MKKTYFYGAVAIGLLFTACKSDDLPGAPDEVSKDHARTLYVNLNIRGDVAGNETRAAIDDGKPVNGDVDFQGGEADIQTAYFIFYDKDGNPVGGEPKPVDLSKVVWTPNTEPNTAEKYYQSTVGVTIQNGQENPAQVICYLNPQNADNLTKPLSEIQTATRKELRQVVEGNNNTSTSYFSMSNSVFYTSTASQAPQIAVQIAPNQLFNSEEAAKNALSDASLTVNIFVERYAAKLKFKSVTPTDYTTWTRPINNGSDNPVTLSFSPKKWMLNASCDETYVVKSFREESEATGDILADNYAYTELDEIINKDGGNWDWNSTDYNRSYWAMSPAYFTAEYPEVSSDVAHISTLHQHYYSYNELITGIGATEGTPAKEPVGYTVDTEDYVTEYVHETTVGSKALGSKNIVAALPSIILVGDYTVTVGSTTLPDNTTFYTYGVVSSDNDKPLVYFKANNSSTTGESAVANGESMLRGFIKAATNLYKRSGDNYVAFDLNQTADIEKLVAVFEVAVPSGDVKGALKVPERYRTLQIREGATQAQLNDIYVATTEGYMKINANPEVSTPGTGELTLLQANQELMKVVGYCAEYNAGAAYFNIPVKHYGWYRTTNNNLGKDKINWTKIRVGDFGIVRNHSYNVEVESILGLGTGIGGKDSPIVPPAEENRYYIAYSVNILKWAVVPVQKVKL